MANVNANVNVIVNTQQAVTQLRLLTAEINNFNKQSFAANSAAAQKQKALNQALIDGVRTSGKFSTSIVPITSSVDKFSESLERNRLNLGQYTRYAASQLPGMRKVLTREFDMINSLAEERVKKLNTQFVRIGQSANGMQQALAMTPNALDEFSSRSAIALQRQQIFNRLLRDGSTQLLNWGKNTQWAGRQLMVGFTIPLALLGSQAAKVFKELEAEAVNFKKVYGDMFTTDKEVEQNLSAIKELAKEMTKYGQSAQQTMQLANTAAASGARGEALTAATTQATRLAILGQMEQAQAIETTISLQTAFSLSNEKLAESINFLNSVENQTILSLQDVSEAIPRVASVISGFGGNVQDLSVLLVAMKEGGVSAAEGSNALKNSMARIISPTRNALDITAKYGISLQEIVSRNKGQIVPLFMELSKALEAIGGQPRQEVLSAVFGKFQYARMGTLLSNIAKEGSQAAKAIELTSTSTRDLASTAERELGTVENSISTKFTAALEKAKIALAPVGGEFLKALTPVLEVISKILGKFDELPGGIKTAIVAATAIIGGIAPVLLMVVGLVANGIANISKFIMFLRKQIGVLRGNGEQFKQYSMAELEAGAATASLEGKTSSLTKTMLLQKPAIESLITLYARLAASAKTVAAAMPTTMGIPGAPIGRGGGFAAVAPRLPIVRRNSGGPIFESSGGKTMVPGSGNTDTVPAMLTPGEFVVNKKATQENSSLLHAINNGSKIGGFNKGGQISGVQHFNLGGIAQLLREIALSRNRIGGVSLQRISKGTIASSPRNIYDKEGIPWERWRSGKRSRGYKDLVESGYITEKEYKDMIGSGRYAVHGVSNKFRQSMREMKGAGSIGSSPTIELEGLLKAQENLVVGKLGQSMFGRTAKLKPSSLISGPPQFNTQLSNGSATLSSLGSIGGQHMIGLAEQLMRRNVDKVLARRILNKAARELKIKLKKAEKKAKSQGRKGIGESEFADALVAAEQTALIKYSDDLVSAKIITANKGGLIPGYNNGKVISSPAQKLSLGGLVAATNAARGARGRIPGNIIDWFSKMTTSINQSSRDELLQNIPANIKRGLSTSRKNFEITRGSIDPISGGSLKEVSSWSTGQGVGRFMESSRLFETLDNSKFQIGQRSQGMKRDIELLKTLGPDGPPSGNPYNPFNREDGGILNTNLTQKEIEESGGVVWKANKKKIEARILRDQEFVSGHQKIIDELQESYIPTIYKTSVKKGEKYFDVSERIVPKDDQRINNPAASTEIIQEKEIALLKAKLIGKPTTRIIEKAEAQDRYDKAKEEIKKLRIQIVRKEISREEAQPLLNRLYDESENMASFVNWGRGREVFYPDVVSTFNKGGMIPGVQHLMAGARVKPYIRPKKPAGPRATELEKEVMRKRAEVSVVKDKDLNDLIFRRNNDGKLDLTPEELLVLLRSNPNVSDKQLKEISKYHGSRIRKGIFGNFDKELGYQVRDRSSGTWGNISKVLEERGYPVVQKRNIGGEIFDSTKTSRTIVPGVGNTDTVPAMLTPGEFVINKQSTQKNLPLLHAINDGNVSGFNSGGMIPGYNIGGMVSLSRFIKKILSMPKSKQEIYFRAGMQTDDPKNMSYSPQSLNIVAYQKRRLLKDKAVGELSALKIPGGMNHTREDMQPLGQSSMFSPSPTGRPWTIGSLAVRPGYETLVSQLLGLAARQTISRSGVLPAASTNLSQHSSRTVEFLAKRGIVKDLRSSKTDFNEVTKKDSKGMIRDAEDAIKSSNEIWKISPKELEQSSNMVRGLLRSTRQKKINNTEQLSLFSNGGMIPGYNMGGMVSLSRFIKKISSMPKSKQEIYFRAGMSEKTRPSKFGQENSQEMSFMAYKKRKFLKDKPVGGIYANRTTPSFHAVPENMTQAPVGSQMHMFTTPGEGNFNVGSLFAKKGYEHLAPNLMGLVARESLIRTGLLPSANASLSRYSSKIVNRLVDLGIIKGRKVGPEDLNSFGKKDSRSWLKTEDKELKRMAKTWGVSKEDLNASSNLVRSLIRNAPNRNPVQKKSSFEQLPLFNKGGMIPGFNMGGMVAKKVSDLRSYLSARHGATEKRSWVDPLNSGEMRSGAIHGPGVYQSNMAGRAREYSGLADLRLAVNRDGFVYRNPRDPMSIARVLRGKGYISLDEVKARGLGTDVASYRQLRSEGYKGVTIPQGNGEVWTVDFSSRMKLANSKTPFGLKQAVTDRKQLRTVRQSEKRYNKANAPKRNADDDLTLNRGGFISPTLKMNNGNIVPGMGSKDTVPAMLTPGEFVINKKSTQKNLQLLHAINDGSLPGYQKGTKDGANQTGKRSRLPGEKRISWQTEVAGNKADEARAGRAARTGFQVQREHSALKTSFERETFRFGTKPENLMSNVLRAGGPGSSPKTRDEYLKRLDKYFQDEKERVKKSERTQEQKDRMKANIDKKRDKMMAKIDNNFALNARERQDQAKVLNGMVKDIERGKLSQNSVSKNFVKLAKQNIDAAKSYLAPSRPGITGYKPLTEPRIVQPSSPKVSGSQSSFRVSSNPKLMHEQALTARMMRKSPGVTAAQARQITKLQMMGGRGGSGIPPTFLGMPGMGPPDGDGVKPSQSRMAKMSSGIGKFGMGAGMGLSMAAMIPMMAADKETGKFMGMDASTAMMGMMGGGMLLSLAPMLQGAALPVMAVAAGLGAIAITAKILNDNMVTAAKKAGDFGANLGGTSNALNTISALFGEKTPAQRSTQMQLQFSQEDQEQSFGKFQNYLGSEGGQKFLKDFENLTGAERFKKLSDYLRNAIASGLLDNNTATLFAKTVGLSLNDAVLGSSVVADLRKNVQQTGSRGLLSLAEKREDTAEKEIQKIAKESTIEGDTASNKSKYATVGASIQILQDYSNALALANEEFAAGTISYEEFSKVAVKAREAQDQWSQSLLESLTTKFGSNKDRSLETFNQEIKKIITEEQFSALAKATEDSVFDKAPEVFGVSSDQFDAVAKTEFASALASGMSADQAISLIQEIRDNPEGDLAKIFAERAGEGNALAVAAFSETADVMAESLGLTDQMNDKFKKLGITFLDAGGNIGEFQTFITNLPEALRKSTISSMNLLDKESMQMSVTGGTAIQGAYGSESFRILSGRAYTSAQEKLASSAAGAEGWNRDTKPASSKDKASFQDLQKNILKTQEDFGTEIAVDIQFAADAMQNGKEIDVDRWNTDVQKVSNNVKNIQKNFPPEISSSIEIDFTSSEDISRWSESSNVFAENWLVLEQLDPVILTASMKFLTLDSEGKGLTPDQVLLNSIKIKKAWDSLSKTKNKDVKSESIMTIVSSMIFGKKGEDGKPIDLKEAKAMTDENMKELVGKVGGKVYTADPSIVIQSLQIMIDADQIKKQGESMLASAAGLSKAGLGSMAIKTAEQGRALIDSANAMTKGAMNAVKFSAKTTGGGGGGGGGGKAESPLKSFLKGILDQIKMWIDASAKMGDLNKAKGSFVSQVMKGAGIFDKLNSVKGLKEVGNVGRLQEILAMGPEGSQDFIKKYVKDGKLTKEGKTILDKATATGAAQTIGENVISSRTAGMQTRAGNIAVRSGASKEAVASIAGDSKKSAELVRIQRDVNNGVKGAVKAKKEFIQSEEKAIKKAKDLEEFLKGPTERTIEDITKKHEVNIKALDKEIEKQEGIVEAIQEQIDKLDEKNDDDQWVIRGLERQKELIERQIEVLQRANEVDQARIETLQRQDALRNRESEALGYELDAMSQIEEKIRESYGKRLEALDKIAKVNDYLINQEKQKLGLSQALSEGDIYAATAAVQDIRQSQAEFSSGQMRAGLEQGMENSIEGLRTSGGLTREQAEERMRQIKEQSYQTSLLIRDIEDAIYARNQEMIPLKDQQRILDDQIRIISDSIYGRETQIRDMRKEQLAPAEEILTKMNDQKTQMQGVTDEVISQLEALADQDLGVNEVTKRVDELAQAWHNVNTEIDQANKLAAGEAVKLGNRPKKMAGETSKAFSDRVALWEKKKEEIENRRKAAVDAAKAKVNLYAGGRVNYKGSNESPPAQMMGGGKVMKYSMGKMVKGYSVGKVVGEGSRDSVSAMLTPGEFVIRKAMVNKYGIPMLNDLNQGSFSMPTFNTGEQGSTNVSGSSGSNTNVVAPMYNNYSVNVSVSNSGASADEIANKTLMKIKQLQDTQIRSGRGF